MKILEITSDVPCFDSITKLQQSAFPANEQYPMDTILSLAKKENIHYQAFFDENILCGLTLYIVGEKMLYLFYIAVNNELRSKGYGTQILQWLKNTYSDRSIVLNIEPIDENTSNNEQRIKRFMFYERNGFCKTPYHLSDDSGEYDILSSKKFFDVDEYKLLITALGFDAYHPRVKRET